MMTCRELVELLHDFLENECSQEQRLHIEQHLVRCQECEIFVETYRLTIHICRKLPDKPLPPTLAQRLEALLREVEAEGNQG